MQAGVFGGICLLAFLLSEGRAEELELSKDANALQDEDKAKDNISLRKSGDLEVPSDLKNELSLGVAQTNFRANEGRSGDITESDGRRDSAISNAIAKSDGDGSASAYANSFSDSAQSAKARGASFNPFNEELGPYKPPGSSLSQADGQVTNSNPYDQRFNYPYPQSYPYQPEADNGLYQPSPNANLETDTGSYQRDPGYNPYGQGFNPAQVKNQADNGLFRQDRTYDTYGSELSTGQVQNQADNGLYQPGYNIQPNLNPYSQGSSFPQESGQGDSESNNPIIKPKSMLPNPDQVSDSYSAFPSYYPYTPVSGANAAQTQDNSGSYQPIPVPNPDLSPYERFLVPYKGPSSIQSRGNSEAYPLMPVLKPKEDRYEAYLRSYNQGPYLPNSAVPSYLYSQKDSYQGVPLPDANRATYESYLGPYRDPKAQTDSKEYQPIPIPKPTNEQQEAIARLYSERAQAIRSNSLINYSSAQPQSLAESRPFGDISLPNSGPNYPNTFPSIESRYYQKPINNGGYQTIPKQSLRTPSTEDETDSYQSIPVSESDLSRDEPSMVQSREENSQKIKVQDESNTDEYRPISKENDLNSDTTSSDNAVARSDENNPDKNDIDRTANLVSKGNWNPYEYTPNTPSVAYPRLYPSGGEAAPTYSDNKPAASASTNVNSQGRYSNEYPSESPVRPGGYNPAEPQAPKQPDVNTSGQSLPIAFEDAESRVILPHEYVFPNKMPGGENVIQCTKENEFHHFWSRELECLVCICLNEYGVLQPVCASCGGCQNPPPKLPEIVPRLPESITVLPATPEPFEPIPMMPEPIPTVPQPEPTPEPFPVYPTPEPVTYPPPISFPEPVATLPPPPESARCNPLPTGVPFTNPLHPCQLCICRESLVSGKIDVQIQCKDNPQCIAPTDVTALPPIPDVPVPIPLPICEKFPEDVLFPHPTETCKLCKCAKSLSEEGIAEQQITCYPHPDCVPKVEPITEPPVPSLPIPVDPNQVKPTPEPTVLPPLREPNQTMEPVPLPEVVTVEPLPWPPITTTTPLPELPPPKPGPLPGPSPHESCRPFPPNQTFQHPWDDCQVCVCTEATAVGLITVEVNCYTKASCCIEPPDSVKEVNPGLTKKYVEPLNAVNSPDGSQPATSTNKAPSAYSVSYSPPSGSGYPGSKPAADPLSTPSIVPYSSFVDHSSSYPYQPNYASQYPQYSEYPPRLPVLPGTANNFGYPANYQYAQGDAVGNNYLPQGHFQPFDPRFQTVPAPSYPGMYQRAYDRPMFPPQLRDNYVKPPIPAIGGPGVQNLSPNFGLPQAYSKDRSGKADGPDDNSR